MNNTIFGDHRHRISVHNAVPTPSPVIYHIVPGGMLL